MTPDTRFVLAVLGTPILIAFAFTVLMWLVISSNVGVSFQSLPQLFGEFATTTGFIALAISIPMFLFGLPLHALLVALRLKNWPYYLIGGTIVGVAAPLLLGFLHFFDNLEPGGSDGPPLRGVEASYGFAFLGALLGPATAVVFWLIRRPDRDAANPATPQP